VPAEIPERSGLRPRYDAAAPRAVAALKDFNRWMQDDLGKRPTTRTWRLGKEWYDPKFKLVMEAPEEEVEEVSSVVRREMEGAASLKVRLAVDVGSGRNWLEAK